MPSALPVNSAKVLQGAWRVKHTRLPEIIARLASCRLVMRSLGVAKPESQKDDPFLVALFSEVSITAPLHACTAAAKKHKAMFAAGHQYAWQPKVRAGACGHVRCSAPTATSRCNTLKA